MSRAPSAAIYALMKLDNMSLAGAASLATATTTTTCTTAAATAAAAPAATTTPTITTSTTTTTTTTLHRHHHHHLHHHLLHHRHRAESRQHIPNPTISTFFTHLVPPPAAYHMVKEGRPISKPRPSFLRQLMALGARNPSREKMASAPLQCCVTPSTVCHRAGIVWQSYHRAGRRRLSHFLGSRRRHVIYQEQYLSATLAFHMQPPAASIPACARDRDHATSNQTLLTRPVRLQSARSNGIIFE